MPAENRRFVHSPVGQKPIRRFGICPILARPRNASTNFIGELAKKLFQPFTMSCVFELASAQFLLNPCFARRNYRMAAFLRAWLQPLWFSHGGSSSSNCLSQ